MKPVYNKKYLKAKIKSCNGKINTIFRNNKIPKEDSKFIRSSVILIDYDFRNYFKYVVKEKKMPEYITDEDSDEEIFNEQILMKKIKYGMCLFLYLKYFE